MSDQTTVIRFIHCTVLSRGGAEFVVYGFGADWIVVFAKATSKQPPWRKWFGNRELAEQEAARMLEDYCEWGEFE